MVPVAQRSTVQTLPASSSLRRVHPGACVFKRYALQQILGGAILAWDMVVCKQVGAPSTLRSGTTSGCLFTGH